MSGGDEITMSAQHRDVCQPSAMDKQLGVRCLAQGHLSSGKEDGASAVHSLPPLQFLPDLRLKLATFGLRVRLSLTIRPRLPDNVKVFCRYCEETSEDNSENGRSWK